MSWGATDCAEPGNPEGSGWMRSVWKSFRVERMGHGRNEERNERPGGGGDLVLVVQLEYI